ncbi:hypothetical protein [Alteromonas sp. ASW11-130]|uniref:hypothetical protein n=1 Tax=Alteromonas sp. ASW11-130 TaxID=3015775 RepID=UPI002241D510|nr:hypothetical protein [Alteromonas sp. ASW11-130]MCW8090512.1 hypothetical protein [Alteromonas sp. ASW11-130]
MKAENIPMVLNAAEVEQVVGGWGGVLRGWGFSLAMEGLWHAANNASFQLMSRHNMASPLNKL